MPKRSLATAQGQREARSDEGRPAGVVPTAATYGSSPFICSHACTTNLGASDGSRDNDRPDRQADRQPGWAMAFALGPLGLRDTPVEYLEALRRLKAMRQVEAKYVRPTRVSAGGTSNANAYGIFSKVPPEDRLVAEELNGWAHARVARASFSSPSDCREQSWGRSSFRPSIRWSG